MLMRNSTWKRGILPTSEVCAAFSVGPLAAWTLRSQTEIQNPKLHLKNLLGDRVYNARVSEDIARRLDATTITARSPSFDGFREAVINGADTAHR